ncbi:hypothetical protein B0H17DRAFT_1147911 [Mycena rosella]|uniref:Uncharacterized protein n=1 Tax=Mycena rosella TaxID=1033263 RepID=A0AAD7CHE6_MYCRO|nr:hypothetical protein B0H17DRAFT_1147911 [Mycena rosella]
MPILPPRNEQTSRSGPSVGITFGATLGGLVLFSLFVFLLFLAARWRELGKQERARTREILFAFGRLEDTTWKEDHSSHPESDAPSPQAELDLQSTPLLTTATTSSNRRPSIPRLTIPPSPDVVKSPTAGSSGSMKSSESKSTYSQYSAASRQTRALRAGPSNPHPSSSHLSPVQLYAAATHPRRSPHPRVTDAHLVADPSIRRDSMGDPHSPFTVASARESYSRDLLPMSSISRLSEEHDPSGGETTPTAGAQPPETPSFDAYRLPPPTDVNVPPLPQRETNREGEIGEI